MLKGGGVCRAASWGGGGGRRLGNSQVLLLASHPQGRCQGRHGDPRDSTSEQKRTNSLPRIRTGLLAASPLTPSSLQGQQGRAGRFLSRKGGGGGRGHTRMTRGGGTKAYKQTKKLKLLPRVAEAWVARASANAAPPRPPPRERGPWLWASHAAARGRGRRERARGLTRLASSARMLHWPTLREGRERQRSVAGGEERSRSRP